MGRDIVSVDECKAAFDTAILMVDTDNNGMLSVRELVSLFRTVIRHGE